MRVVDASVWVGRLVPQDAHYAASRRWLEARTACGGTLIAPLLLLAEVAGAVARRTGSAELADRATDALLALPNLRLVALDPRLGRASARLAADLGLKGADAIYVAMAHLLGLPLVTWDRQQGERAGKQVTVYRPDMDRLQDLGVLLERAGATYRVRRANGMAPRIP
jgi:predicted nucleic acid-binding protein